MNPDIRPAPIALLPSSIVHSFLGYVDLNSTAAPAFSTSHLQQVVLRFMHMPSDDQDLMWHCMPCRREIRRMAASLL